MQTFKKHNSMSFDKYIHLCNHHHNQKTTFRSPQNGLWCPFQSVPAFSIPGQGNCWPAFTHYRLVLSLSDFIHRKSYSIFSYVWLFSLSVIYSRFIHIALCITSML